MRPRTGTRGEVASGGVPLHVCERVVVRRAKELYVAAPILSRLLLDVVRREIEIPELELGLA